MIEITSEIREDVLDYLDCEADVGYSDDLYSFYYRCMMAGMHMADADRYAILNTLLNYDIGMDNARAVDSWMYEHDEEIYELNNSEDSKLLIMQAVTELKLDVDFSGWIKEDYRYYKFFEC